MLHSRKRPQDIAVNREPDDLPWSELNEILSTCELSESFPVEWMLDRARSSDGARP